MHFLVLSEAVKMNTVVDGDALVQPARQVVTVALRVSGEGGESRAGNMERRSDSVSRRRFAYAGCMGPGPCHMRVCVLLPADGGSCSWCWLSRAGSDTVSVACVL